MKTSFKQMALGLIATVAATNGSIAFAQFTSEQLGEIKEGYRQSTTPQLSIDTSVLMVAAGWHCGGTAAKQIFEDLRAGKEPSIGAQSRECQIDSIKLKFALDEATARAKQQLQKHDILETPNTTSTFTIAFSQMTPLEKIETTGGGFCLEQAQKILARWQETEKFNDSFSELKNNSVVNCQISRRGDENVGRFGCQNWLTSSKYDFKTGEIKMLGGSVHLTTEAEKKALKEMVHRDKDGKAKTEDLYKWLRADLESGIHFAPVVTLQKGASTAVIEIRGVAGPEWQKSMTVENEAGRTDISKMPALCSVRAEVKATSTEPR